MANQVGAIRFRGKTVRVSQTFIAIDNRTLHAG
jgi:hypothetical protein